MKSNDSAWQKVFDKYEILDAIQKDGRFVVLADQMREFGEPRLMAKFDHKEKLPEIFIKNNLSILPVFRGGYVIAPFVAYETFPSFCQDVQKVTLPSYLQSLSPQFLISESITLNYAYACGILNDFLEDSELVPTVCGRMGTGFFEFEIKLNNNTLQNVSVDNSQMEIDAAYEGRRYLSVFEAKKEDLSEDFLIRQLYYPFRVWKERMVEKEVKTIFLRFSNGVFQLYQYLFEDPYNYNSLRLVKQKRYMIATKISLTDIESILKNVSIIPEPAVPFPQADSMLRIINLLALLHEGAMTKHAITTEFAFDKRQTDYYTNAGLYLGLVEKKRNKNGVFCHLSQLGEKTMRLGYKERQLTIVSQILKHKIFHDVLSLHLQSGEMPDQKLIKSMMISCSLHNIDSEETFDRRSSTIIGWTNWILSLIDE